MLGLHRIDRDRFGTILHRATASRPAPRLITDHTPGVTLRIAVCQFAPWVALDSSFGNIDVVLL